MTDTELVAEIARARYGATPGLTRLPSFNNDVYLLTFPGGLPDKVIKLAGREHGEGKNGPMIRREQAILRALGAAGLAVPPVEGTQDDVPVPSRPFLLMPRLPGGTLEETARTNPAWAQSMWEAAGRFAAQIGMLGSDLLPLWDAPETAITVEAARNSFARHGLLRPLFARLLNEAEALSAGAPSFVHGDYAASQIITDGSRFTVIDWESAGPGHPLAMLGYFIAMQREYDRDRVGNDERIAWVIAGYEGITPLTDETRRALHVWEMFAHLATMSWKIGWEPDHAQHAREMVGRVEEWTTL